MNVRKLLAALVGILLGIVALLCTFVLEALGAGLVLAALFPSRNGATVGWDPVSLWHQSVQGKAFVTAIFGLPVLIALVAFALVFTYTYSCLSRTKQQHTLA